MTSFWI